MARELQRAFRIETMRLDGGAHGVRMKDELGGDGSDLPMFGEEKAPLAINSVEIIFSDSFGERD